MRTLDGGQTAVLAAATRSDHVRVWIENGSGTLKEITNLASTNWLDSLALQADIDQFAERVTLNVIRENSAHSLAPLREDSTLNRLDDGTTYAPLIDPNRLVVVETATLAVGATPSAGDWEEVFRGHVGSVDSSAHIMRVECYGLGRRLVRRQLIHPTSESVTFGTPFTGSPPTGLPIEDAIQEVLDYVTWSEPDPVLFVPDSPLTEVGQWSQPIASVADALQNLAGSIGWVIRYKYDEGPSDAGWKLTLYDPQRDKTVPDYTFAANRYFSIDRLDLDDEPVKNFIYVYYTPETTGIETFKLVFDTASALRFDIVEGFLVEDPDGIVRSDELATAMGNAALSDLKDPKAEVVIELPYFWPVELGDLYRFTANGVHSDVDQDWAVTGIHHELSQTTQRTRLMVRGRPAGAFYGWFRIRGQVDRPVPESARPSIPQVWVTFDENGVATIHLFGAANTRSFRVPHNIEVGIPDESEVAGWSFINAVNGEASFVVGAPTALAVGETLYWRARAYSEQDGVGLSSPEDAIGAAERPQTSPRVNAGSFSPWIATSWEGSTAFLDGPILKGGTFGSGSSASADVTALLPLGGAVRGIRARVFTGVPASGVLWVAQVRLRRVSSTGVSTTVFEMEPADTITNQDWITISTSTLEGSETGVISTGESWYLDATVEVSGYLLWAEIDYTATNGGVGLFPGSPANQTIIENYFDGDVTGTLVDTSGGFWGVVEP